MRLGIAGLGGYARTIASLALEGGPTTEPRVALVAACEPRLEDHAGRVATLCEQGVRVVRGFEELLAIDAVEAVWLPVPIDLHVPYAKAALRVGKAVMVEKPVAGTVDELDELIAARDAAGRPVAVGFQDVYDPVVLSAKRRLLSGTLGRVERATVWGCWPRSAAYFGRVDWAGAIRRGGAWVLDSPVNNALAHYINLALFLLGPDEASSATPTHIEAELYRAAEIENYDTASLRVRLAEGPELLVLMSHASLQLMGPVAEIQTTGGGLRVTAQEVTMRHDGQVETLPRDGQVRLHMLGRFARLARGVVTPDAAVAALEMARAHALVVNGASEAVLIRPVPPTCITVADLDGYPLRAIDQIDVAFERCAREGLMLHESGMLPFTRPAGACDLVGYKHFAGPRLTPTVLNDTVARV